MVLAGMWYSDKKPPMQHFLEPIVKELQVLEDLGIKKYIHNYRYNLHNYKKLYAGFELTVEDIHHMIVNVHAVCVCCDLPAKALVQNFIQFNGSYGFGFCEQPGEVISTAKGGNVTTFPFVVDDPKSPCRTQQKCIIDAQKAIIEGSVVII